MTESPTLKELQRLNDGLHELGDAVLRHNYPHLRSLRPHGINTEGKPIAGTPDSYVGASHHDCVVAVEYTTTTLSRLESKLKEDFDKSAAKCKKAREIVLCTNRPRDSRIEKSLRAHAKHAGRKLRLVWGEDIAVTLDDQRQDLRELHLGIPVESLRRHSIVPVLRARVTQAIDAHLGGEGMQALDSHLPRRPLNSQFNKRQCTRRVGVTLVYGPAGQGKTTWSCANALDLSAQNPVVWMRAREIDLSKNGLAKSIVSAAYGSDDSTRIFEMARVLKSDRRHLVVFVDAIDEVEDYQELQERLHYFRAHSILAPRTHLVLSCRAEAVALFESTATNVLPQRGQSHYARLRIPRFHEAESATLLSRLGATNADIAELQRILPGDFYANPLYLKLARKLQQSGELPTEGAAWVGQFAKHYIADIRSRLRAGGKTPSERLVQATLEQVALAALADPQGVDPDRLGATLIDAGMIGEATFVERAVQSGLLVRNAQRIHFSHALLCEYFAARKISRETNMSAVEKVRLIASLPGKASIARLAIAQAPSLLPALASEAPELIDTFDRACLSDTEALLARAGELLCAHYPSHRRAGARILAAIGGQLAEKIAVEWFNHLTSSEKASRLDEAADLFLQLELRGAVHVIAMHHEFAIGRQFSWYEPQFSKRLEQTSVTFRQSLAEHAVNALTQAEIGSHDEARLTMILGHLRDSRLLSRLREKAKSGPLASYEHRALIHFNTEEAMQVYLQSREHYYRELDSIDPSEDPSNSRRAEIWHQLVIKQGDVVRFPHDALVRVIERELLKEGRERAFALDFAETLQSPQLISAYAEAAAEHRGQGFVYGPNRMIDDLVQGMAADDVIETYGATTSVEAKRSILRAAGEIPSARIEQLLLTALDDEELFRSAAIGLTAQRSYEAGPVFHERLSGADRSLRHILIKGIGRIRYEPALEDLIRLLKNVPTDYTRDDHAHSNDEFDLVTAVGSIGGARAVDALVERFRARPNNRIIACLLDSNDKCSLEKVHELLAEGLGVQSMIGYALDIRGHLHGDRVLYSHDAPVPEFDDETVLDALIDSALCKVEGGESGGWMSLWHDVRAVALFDSPKAIGFLEDIAGREVVEGSPELSSVSYARRVLAQRGHTHWVEHEIERELELLAGRDWVSTEDISRLEQWPAPAVRLVLRRKIEREPARLGTWIYLFVSFATVDDYDLIHRNIDKVPAAIADIVTQKLPALPEGGAAPELEP